MSKKIVNMVWANEAGVSVYVYEGEHDRRIIEVHGLVNERETVIATATIEKHNRDNFAQSIALNSERATCSRGAKIGESLGIVP